MLMYKLLIELGQLYMEGFRQSRQIRHLGIGCGLLW
jgi:hypothetical protein